MLKTSVIPPPIKIIQPKIRFIGILPGELVLHQRRPALKPIQPPGPEDLYDVINERYERGSILLTSNRAPNEWPDLFLDPLLASAGLDRLLDRSEVVIIRGASYRAQGRARLTEEVPPSQKQP